MRWAKSPRPTTLQAAAYGKAIAVRVRALCTVIERELRPVLEQIGKREDSVVRLDDVATGWRIKVETTRRRLFADDAVAKVAQRAGAAVSRRNADQVKSLVPIPVNEDLVAGPRLRSFVAENVRLIKSIPEQLLDQVEDVLNESVGSRVETIAKRLQERFDVAESRANLIARDQTLKLNASLGRARMEAAGVTQYVWTTSRDERVRESHAALDGQTFSFADPPEVDGEQVNPGEAINCRCTAYPLAPAGLEALDDL